MIRGALAHFPSHGSLFDPAIRHWYLGLEYQVLVVVRDEGLTDVASTIPRLLAAQYSVLLRTWHGSLLG